MTDEVRAALLERMIRAARNLPGGYINAGMSDSSVREMFTAALLEMRAKIEAVPRWQTNPDGTSYLDGSGWILDRDEVLALFPEPPEPPKPVLCKHCGKEIVFHEGRNSVWIHTESDEHWCMTRAEPSEVPR